MGTKRKKPTRSGPNVPFRATTKLIANVESPKPPATPTPKKAPSTAPTTTPPTVTTSLTRGPASTRIPTTPKALHEEILRLIDDVANNFYRIGTCLRVMKETKWYLDNGFPSFSAMLAALESRTRFNAHQLIEVARELPEPVALELGISRAYRTIRLVSRTYPGARPADIIAADPSIPVHDDEPPLPLSSLDVKLLDSAIRKLRGKSVPGQRRAQTAARALAQLFENTGIDPNRVRSRLTSRGWHVNIDLPPNEAEELANLLSRKKR